MKTIALFQQSLLPMFRGPSLYFRPCTSLYFFTIESIVRCFPLNLNGGSYFEDIWRSHVRTWFRPPSLAA